MFNNSQDTNCLLSYIMKRIDPDILTSSIELYKTGSLAEITCNNDLILTHIKDHAAPGGKWNIRLKLQSQGNVIRWFECGCSFQRKTGFLCEHIVAALINIEREHPKLLKSLNPNAPFAISKIGSLTKKKPKKKYTPRYKTQFNSALQQRPISSPNSFAHMQNVSDYSLPASNNYQKNNYHGDNNNYKSNIKKSNNLQSFSKDDKNDINQEINSNSLANYSQNLKINNQLTSDIKNILLSNPMISLMLQSTIVSIKQMESTGRLKVTFELRRSKKDQITLNVDQSAAFLLYFKDNKQINPKIKNFKINHDIEVLAGWKLAVNTEDEIWNVQKAGIISASSDEMDYLSVLDILENHKDTRLIYYVKSTDNNSSESYYQNLKKSNLLSFSYKYLDKYTGNHFVYFKKLGYFFFKLPKNDRNFWSKSQAKRYYRGAEIDTLIENRFNQYFNSAPTLIKEKIDSICIINTTLDRIKIIEQKEDWFLIDPQCTISNRLVSLSELLILSKDKNRRFVYYNNNWVKTPAELFDLDFYLDHEKKAIQINTITLIRWRSLVPTLDSLFFGSKDLIAKIANKLSFNIDLSADLKLDHTNLKLRDYQIEGVKWLWWLYNNHLHGLFADDMGLGKTHQTMALLAMIHEKKYLKSKKNTDADINTDGNINTDNDEDCDTQTGINKLKYLVICPTTVVGHWIEKINEFAAILKPLRYHGTDRIIDESYNTLITSYGVLLRDIDIISKRKWDVVVCDEAHVIKNPKTSTYWACKKLKAKMRLCLSGTPIENRLSELKTLFDFLLPGFLGNTQFFKKYYEITITTDKKEQNTQDVNNIDNKTRLLRLIEPLKLRRTKDQVLDDLPEKIEDIRHCELSDLQKSLYIKTLDLKGKALISDLKDKKKSVQYIHIFTLLQRLKQICNHPSLITKNNWEDERSEKFELLKQLLEESIGSGHKVVIFSQYVKMIEIINDYLQKKSIPYVSLQGSTRNRDQLVSQFQNDPNVKVFVGSLIAGGVGIDLTSASVVIHYDRWWNPSKENQATDRVHRIGQKKSLLVLKLVTLGTIEEKVNAMIERKKLLFDTLLTSDESQFKQFTRKELIELVSHDTKETQTNIENFVKLTDADTDIEHK